MSAICLADAWTNAYESLLALALNEHEQLRARQAFQALLDRCALAVESSSVADEERVFCRRVHEFPDTSFIVGTADVPVGKAPAAVDWTYSKPDQDSPAMFTFGTLEVLSNTLSSAFWPNWDLVTAVSSAMDRQNRRDNI